MRARLELRPCAFCGAPFRPRPDQIRRGVGRYCSRPCAASRATAPARFWSKVITAEGDACWLWQGARDGHGYGNFVADGRRHDKAHRVAWALSHGTDVPSGMEVLHRCDNPPCVRPDHLFVGTRRDNMRDASEKGRIARGITAGHAKLTEEQVLTLRALRRTASATVLAAMFKISRAQVDRIAKGERWRHLR